jgi:hypothetical protein
MWNLWAGDIRIARQAFSKPKFGENKEICMQKAT